MNTSLARIIAGCALFFGTLAHGDTEAAGKRGSDRAFIEETRIAAPKRVGEFVLEGTRFDEATKENGVQVRYALSSHPDIRFDLFIFPAGDMPHDKAVGRAVDEFVAGLEGAQKQGYFEDLRILDTSDFRIDPAQGDGESRIVASDPAITELLNPRPIVGKRLDLRYRSHPSDGTESTPMLSRGYLFHKQLYYFKGRITTPAAQISAEDFASLSDRAMRELVPAVVASNIGGCAEVTIELPRSGSDQDDETIGALLLSQLTGALADKSDRNCYRSRSDARAEEPKGAEVETIEYDADDWSGQ